MKIMEELSKILGVYVTDKNFEKEIGILDRSGGITQRKILEMVLMLIKKFSEFENGKNTTL